MTYCIVQIPPRNPERDPFRLYEVAYRDRRGAIAAVKAHHECGYRDADYIEIEGEYDECTP